VAQGIQPALTTAGYIRHMIKLDIEQKHIKTRDITAQLLNFSFDPDQPTTDITHMHCPYSTRGADITITHRAKTPACNFTDNVSSVLAFANAHLQKFEKRKLNCINKKEVNDNIRTIKGDEVIGNLLN
jgi:hypothetical protein